MSTSRNNNNNNKKMCLDRMLDMVGGCPTLGHFQTAEVLGSGVLFGDFCSANELVESSTALALRPKGPNVARGTAPSRRVDLLGSTLG